MPVYEPSSGPSAMTSEQATALMVENARLHRLGKWLTIALAFILVGLGASAFTSYRAVNTTHDIFHLEESEQDRLSDKLTNANIRVEQLIQTLSDHGVPIPSAPPTTTGSKP
jgi:hypothetical protein